MVQNSSVYPKKIEQDIMDFIYGENKPIFSGDVIQYYTKSMAENGLVKGIFINMYSFVDIWEKCVMNLSTRGNFRILNFLRQK